MDSINQSLIDLGWRSFFSAQISESEEGRYHPVRVLSVHRGKIAVAGAGAHLFINPHMPDAVDADDHPTVGDWLLIDEETLQPVRILRRANLSRPLAKARHGGKFEQRHSGATTRSPAQMSDRPSARTIVAD